MNHEPFLNVAGGACFLYVEGLDTSMTGKKRPKRPKTEKATTAKNKTEPIAASEAKKEVQQPKEAVKEEVKKEVKEAVKETVSAWRAFLKPRVLLVTGAAVILLLIAILLVKIDATIRQDLVIILTPTSEHLDLAHGETATVGFSLGTNNYLFCQANCSYRLRELTVGTVLKEGRLLLENSQANFTFSFKAPEKGEGQLLYSLEIMCENRENSLCVRKPEPHSMSALITLDYRLTEEEKAARDRARSELVSFLNTTRSIDLAAQAFQQDIAVLQDGRGLALDGLEENLTPLLEERDRLVASATRLAASWRAEQYGDIAPPDTAPAQDAATAFGTALDRYLADQHALVDSLRALPTRQTELEATAIVLAVRNRTRALQGYLGAAARLARNLAFTPTANAQSRLASLQLLETGIAGETAGARSWLDVSIAEGRKLLVLEQGRMNLSVTAGANASASASPNPTPSNITRNLTVLFDEHKTICAGLYTTGLLLATHNLTTTNATTAYLGTCAALDSANVSLPGIDEIATLAFVPVTLPPTTTHSAVTTTLPAPQSECCLFNRCGECCDTRACGKQAPILFLHGHSADERNSPRYSLEAFSAFQELLEQDEDYIDAGVLTPFDLLDEQSRGVWSEPLLPVSVSGTYYYDAYLQGGSYILSVEPSESIDTYAIRVKGLVDNLLLRTGSEKVVIVAHSMGGLVARRYLQVFGDAKVARLVLLGTPNHGVEASVASICPVIGADKECAEMRADSPFLARLNDPARQPSIPVTVVYGLGCDTQGEPGDGVVTAASARLDGAENVAVNGSCAGTDLLHTEMLDPVRYPAVFGEVKALLAS